MSIDQSTPWQGISATAVSRRPASAAPRSGTLAPSAAAPGRSRSSHPCCAGGRRRPIGFSVLWDLPAALGDQLCADRPAALVGSEPRRRRPLQMSGLPQGRGLAHPRTDLEADLPQHFTVGHEIGRLDQSILRYNLKDDPAAAAAASDGPCAWSSVFEGLPGLRHSLSWK
jgi:hypothetical protein